MQNVGITTTPPVLGAVNNKAQYHLVHDNQPSLKTNTVASSRLAEGVASATLPLNKCKKTQTDRQTQLPHSALQAGM